MSYLNSVSLIGFCWVRSRATPSAEQRCKIHRLLRRHSTVVEERRRRMGLEDRMAPNRGVSSASRRTRSQRRQERRSRPLSKAASSARPTTSPTEMARRPRPLRSPRRRFAPRSCASSTAASPSLRHQRPARMRQSRHPIQVIQPLSSASPQRALRHRRRALLLFLLSTSVGRLDLHQRCLSKFVRRWPRGRRNVSRRPQQRLDRGDTVVDRREFSVAQREFPDACAASCFCLPASLPL